jgi:disulfide bond formation protein DsbB
MLQTSPLFDDPARRAAILIGLAAAATIIGAWIFEWLGYLPCPLCLQQRTPYYVAIPLAGLTAYVAGFGRRLASLGLALIFLAFLYNAGLGAYHAGAEWRFWSGPSDCAAGAAPSSGSVADFRARLNATRVISCTEPAIRIFGVSLAGWNVLISAGLAALALAGLRGRADQGSSSLSQ